MKILALTFLALAALAIFFVWLRERRLHGRSKSLSELMDLADALEAELREARARLREIAGWIGVLPATSRESAQRLLAVEPQIQTALRDLLSHRLWLRDKAAAASAEELAAARASLVATRDALASQLARLAEVRAELEAMRESLGEGTHS